MKQGRAMITFVIVAMAVVLAAYMALGAWRTLAVPYETSYAYAFTLNDSVEAQALLVRQEQVLSPVSGIVDTVCQEGEKVSKGGTVARVYRDSSAMATQNRLEEVALELDLLGDVLGQQDETLSASQIDEDILTAVSQLRGSVSVRDFSRLEDQVRAVKSGVLKRAYTYSDEAQRQELSTRLTQLKQEYESLSAQSAQGVSLVTAPVSGVYSALADGYETLLTPDNVLSLTAADLNNLMEQRPQAPDSPGKLITSNTWYLAVPLPDGAAADMSAGDKVTVRFTGDFNGDVDMRVVQVGESRDGEAAVVLSASRSLNDTTLLRSQTVEIIYNSYSGLRLPDTAVRMVEKEVTDQKTGETTVEQVLGVYAVVGGRAEFKPVTILVQGDGYCVVKAASEGASSLRAGQQVISSGTDLYDGKLLDGPY